jgi:hypothetical protein
MSRHRPSFELQYHCSEPIVTVMFRWLGHSLRIRGAIFLVAVYAACAMAPTAALALSHGALSPHCMSKDHQHGSVMVAERLDARTATINISADHNEIALKEQSGEKQSSSQTCCGMFCISAIAFEHIAVTPHAPVSSPMRLALEQYSVACEANLLDRPPIAL